MEPTQSSTQPLARRRQPFVVERPRTTSVCNEEKSRNENNKIQTEFGVRLCFVLFVLLLLLLLRTCAAFANSCDVSCRAAFSSAFCSNVRSLAIRLNDQRTKSLTSETYNASQVVSETWVHESRERARVRRRQFTIRKNRTTHRLLTLDWPTLQQRCVAMTHALSAARLIVISSRTQSDRFCALRLQTTLKTARVLQ